MIHKETFDAFVEGLNTEKAIRSLGDTKYYMDLKTLIEPNGTDLFVYPLIPDDVKYQIRRNFDLSLDEEILYVRDSSSWNDRNQGVVLTDCGIIWIPDNDNIQNKINFSWEIIEHVEYKDECLYFFGYSGRDDNYPIRIWNIIKGGGGNIKMGWIGDVFQRILNRMARTQVHKSEDEIYEITVDQYNLLIDEGKDEDALQLALNYRKERENVSFKLYYIKTKDSLIGHLGF